MDREPELEQSLASVRNAFVDTLIRSIESDRFASVNQMEIVEAAMTPEQRARYLQVLIDKVERDYPVASVPLMHRILRLGRVLNQ